MARSDPDEGRGGKSARHVSRNSHPAAGGHPSRAGPTRSAKSPLAKANRSQWDSWDEPSGGDGPDDGHVFVEYPKHVTVDGVLYVAQSAEHEAQITGSNP